MWDKTRHSHKEALKELAEERDVLTKQIKSLKSSLEETKEQNQGKLDVQDL